MSTAVPVTDLAAFVSYAVAMSITPGPNNAMLATLGARHGWRGAAPYALGVSVGMFALLALAGAGVGSLLDAAPGLRRGLALAGVAYMAWLAVALWRSESAAKAADRPAVGFWGALAFQAVNPKALLMAITAAGTFLVPSTGAAGALGMALLFTAIGAPCIAVWALAGDRLRGWLAAPGRAVVFSRTMAALVAATAVAMALEA